MKKALAVICYGRDRYFELVIPSILNQKIFGRNVSELYDIYFFQDGLWEDEGTQTVTGHKSVAKELKLISSTYPVFQQDKNLGVALHFDFIERLLFEQKLYDFVAFFEDDLVLAPGYMQAVDLMAEKFHDDPRVGMVSAHPANPTISLETQRENRNKFAPIGHNWGFGISRSFWLRRQPFVDCYLDLIQSYPYRNRDEKKVFVWLEASGFRGVSSSQDFIKACSTTALGSLRLSTAANFGLPIGRSGLNFRPENFKQMGFDQTVIYNEPLTQLGELDEQQFYYLFKTQGIKVGDQFAQHKSDDQIAWQKKLLSGELHPNRIMAALGIPGDFDPKYFQIASSNTHINKEPKITQSNLVERNQSKQEIEMIENTDKKKYNILMDKLYGENIWNGYLATHGVKEVQGWNGNHPVFAKLIREIRPSVVVDVGVWKGLSSITLAHGIKEAGCDGCVLSVDTFLGSPEHWSRSRNLFQRKHGYPDLYDQFMSNVYNSDMQDLIIPMPQLSHVAARLLKNMEIKADLIHIDAAHEYEEVLRDAIAYWEVLGEGGVMIGDDYHPTWPGVVRAADEFAAMVGRNLEIDSPKWILRK